MGGGASAERALRRAAARRSSEGAGAAESGVGGGAESRARARAKLDEAKSTLHLTGTAVQGSAGRPSSSAPVGQSERATASQTKARLLDIQRKRAELIRKRQMVRNYNERDAPDAE